MTRLRLTLAFITWTALGPAAVSTADEPAGPTQTVLLWPAGAPGALGSAEADKPRLHVFVPQKRSTGAAVLIVPGGGYTIVALGHEGFQVARWLNAQGMTAFVLDYRVDPYRYPVPIDDGRRAMRHIRARAALYGVDATRIGVWGFSAGGHLASSLGTHACGPGDRAPGVDPDSPALDGVDAQECRPDFMVLSYPVISMEWPGVNRNSLRRLFGPYPEPELVHEYSNQFGVTARTPPAFLFATTRDHRVRIGNSLDFYRALEQAGVPAELHIYDYADHGCGLCGSISALATWPALLRNWLEKGGWLPHDAPPPPAPEPNDPLWPPGIEGPGKPAAEPHRP